jgi:hypothetical protein
MGPAILLLPIGLIALIAAAASSKKKTQSTGTGSAAAYQPPATTGTVPADVQAMIAAAVNSGNPETQRRVAATIRAQYPAQAQYLETVASQLEPILAQWGASTLAEAQQKEAQAAAVAAAQQAAAQQAAQGAPPVAQVAAAQTAAAQTIQQASAAQASQPPLVTPAVTTTAPVATTVSTPPLTPPTAAAVAQAMTAPAQALQAAQAAGTAALAAGATIPQAVLAAQNAATMATNPAVNAAVQTAVANAPSMPTPPMAAPVTTSTPAANAGKALAADLAKALAKGKKGTASEPKAMVQAFQKQEGLTKQDGSYGYETALALADRYAIVPPKPMYWGEKNGAYDLVAKQKQAYSAHLLALASQDPQRADEWKAAAKV